MDKTMHRKPSAHVSETRKVREQARLGAMDLPFLMLTLLITCIGLIMLFSASYASSMQDNNGNATKVIVNQALFAAIGIASMLLVSRIEYRFWQIFAPFLMLISVVFLILVPFIGTKVKGARRWINLGFTSFQPSEVAKLALIVLFASMIVVYKEKMKTFRYGVIPFAAILLILAGLMVLQPHLSGTVLLVCVGGAMMFLGGVPWGWFAGLFALGGGAGYMLTTVLPYAQSRIDLWRNPWTDPSDKGYQAIQSLYAIGSGGWFGLGLGNSRQKFLYLPEEHNDFIFAIVCEELGLIGAILVLLLFSLLIIRGFWISLHAPDRFGSLVVAGISTLLALHMFFNVAVVTGLVPVTGISMPFFSAGGTSLIIQLVEMGIVLAVSRKIPAPKAG